MSLQRKSTRRPKTNRVPCTRAGGEWTEAAFWSFLRSVLRSGSRRWPPIVRQALLAVRRPYVGPNKRQKWEYQCAFCGDWFKGADVQVDHIEECGSLKCAEDIGPFAMRLYCEADGLRVGCKQCHNDRTQESKTAAAIRKLTKE